MFLVAECIVSGVVWTFAETRLLFPSFEVEVSLGNLRVLPSLDGEHITESSSLEHHVRGR